MNKIRVLIVDDAALIRNMLTELLGSADDIEVVGTAPDPLIARDKIKRLNPDVITLDVEMPKMDGLTFLSNLMRLRPMPVVMISSLTQKGADTTFQALEMGAVDFVSKPEVDLAGTFHEYSEEIISKVRMAAKANVKAISRNRASMQAKPKLSADEVISKAPPRSLKTTDQIIAVGASTGGTEAIKEFLSVMPADSPGIVITQHIPAAFSEPFSKRMDSICAMKVFHAEDRQQIIPGHVYIAPGDKHLMVERSGARYYCRLHDGPPVNRHKPSVDVLFRSVVQHVGKNAIGVLLTGMGDDGARGLKELHDIGAPTIAQDEQSSVVWGMPGEAVKLGAAEHVLPLNRVHTKVLSLVRSPSASD
jgi:two-component system chemotaxis response regulator CheB